MNINFMDIDLLLRLCVLIVVIGITVKAIRLISGIAFKIASVVLIMLLLYKMLI